MNLVDHLINELKNETHTIIYISKNPINLETIHNNILSSIDLSKTSSSLILTRPNSIAEFKQPIDEVFFDCLSTSPEFLLKFLDLRNKDNIFEVDPATLNYKRIH